MSEHPVDREAWTEEEKRALEIWVAPEPPADFVARVTAQAGLRKRSTPKVAALLAAAAAIAAAVLVLDRGEPDSHGEHRAAERATVAIGRRATVVSEAGTVLS